MIIFVEIGNFFVLEIGVRQNHLQSMRNVNKISRRIVAFYHTKQLVEKIQHAIGGIFRAKGHGLRIEQRIKVCVASVEMRPKYGPRVCCVGVVGMWGVFGNADRRIFGKRKASVADMDDSAAGYAIKIDERIRALGTVDKMPLRIGKITGVGHVQTLYENIAGVP